MRKPCLLSPHVWLLIGSILFSTLSLFGQETNSGLAEVKPVDLSKIDPKLFAQDEWFVPYYLKNFSKLANSVLDTGANKGFISIHVWRTPDVNKPYNARIMESILSLVWFYTNQRPWNVYYGDQALKARIEAALTFWCNMQKEDGHFSEYAPDNWSLAPTAFATKFIGRALYLLKGNPTLDAAILERTRQTMRKALFIIFTDPDLWEHGRDFTNQYENVWGGALMYLEHYPDEEIEQLFHKRLKESMKEFQSPCGYFYEKNGPDWGYNLSTHHSDLHVAWHYVKGTSLQQYFIDKTQKWYDWFSYNAVKEPGVSGYYLNKAIETRQQRWYIKTDTLENPSAARWTPQAEFIPQAHAFTMSREEYEKANKLHYQRMLSRYPETDELKIGEFSTFSPYAFLHHQLVMWFPTEGQKKQAIENLPYLKNENFTEVRRDNRNNTVHAFARRDLYYAIFNGGKILTPSQRYGLGLVWNPKMGTVLQSQSNSDKASWGTKTSGSTQVYEAQDISPEFALNGSHWEPSEGKNQPEGKFTVSYSLKTSGYKVIEFNDKNISITVTHSGDFTEIIPLLVDKKASLKHNDQMITLQTEKGSMAIKVKAGAKVRKLEESISTRSHKPCYVLEINARDKLIYEFNFKN